MEKFKCKLMRKRRANWAAGLILSGLSCLTLLEFSAKAAVVGAKADAAIARAEWLLQQAIGEEKKSAKKDASARKTELTDVQAEEAATLLAHDDPFVRGIAEWALAIRLAQDFEGAERRVNGRRIAKAWPEKDAPAWYQKWANLPPETALEFDYVRQAVSLGIHKRPRRARWCRRAVCKLFIPIRGSVRRPANGFGWITRPRR